jgi:chromosome segregation ATPase
MALTALESHKSEQVDVRVSYLLAAEIQDETQPTAEFCEKCTSLTQEIESKTSDMDFMKVQLEVAMDKVCESVVKESNQSALQEKLQTDLAAKNQELEVLSANIDHLHVESEGPKETQDSLKKLHVEECHVLQDRAEANESKLESCKQEVNKYKQEMEKKLASMRLEMAVVLQENQVLQGRCKQADDALTEAKEESSKYEKQMDGLFEIKCHFFQFKDHILTLETDLSTVREHISNSDKREAHLNQNQERMNEAIRILCDKVIQLNGNIRVFVCI